MLPYSVDLPIAKLAGAFSNTSATYKFYWFIAIIEMVEEGKLELEKKDIFARMISNAWYTVNYFKISFGHQDLIQQAVGIISEREGLTVDVSRSELNYCLANSTKKETVRALWHFNKNVPHWFLSPWFPRQKAERDSILRARIYRQSEDFDGNCPYALKDESIAINPAWVAYLRANAMFLKHFCYWNLALFLQSRNPSVPDIAGKLLKPPFRGSLSLQRKGYWDIVFRELGTAECIFTGKLLRAESYALDHFVPHAFVSHDQMWNLLPIDRSFNSSKSDRLPDMERHFDGFFRLQETAYKIMLEASPSNRLLQEYLVVFPELNGNQGFEIGRYRESMRPLVTMAHNNGFLYL